MDRRDMQQNNYRKYLIFGTVILAIIVLFLLKNINGLFDFKFVQTQQNQQNETEQQEQTTTVNKEEKLKYDYSLPEVYYTNERYRILSIEIYDEKVFAILCLDNGQVKYLQLTNVSVDKEVKDIKNAYLYRENGQIYIKQK